MSTNLRHDDLGKSLQEDKDAIKTHGKRINDKIEIWQTVVDEPGMSLLTSAVVHHAGILLKAVYQLVFREYKHGENYCDDHKTNRTTTASGAARVVTAASVGEPLLARVRSSQDHWHPIGAPVS